MAPFLTPPRCNGAGQLNIYSGGNSMNASRDHATAPREPAAAAAIPALEISQLVANTLGTILGSPIGLQETFWDAGGTSLAFIDLAARLEEELGVMVRAEDV